MDSSRFVRCTQTFQGTEVCYCVLSLVAKLYLGWFLLLTVIRYEDVEEALAGAEA